MPRTPIPEHEKDIGRRLREALLRVPIAQTEFARKLEINVSTLRSYEEGRSRLPAIVGLNACRVLDLSPVWLMKGKESIKRKDFEGRIKELIAEAEALAQRDDFQDLFPLIDSMAFHLKQLNQASPDNDAAAP